MSTAESPASSFFQKHQLAFYVALAYLLSWWPWLIYVKDDPNSVGAPILPIGPLIAVLIVLAVVGGRSALLDLFRRIVRWRVGWKFWAIVLLMPWVLTLAALALNLALGATPIASFEFPGIAQLIVRFVFILLWIGLGEEPGWRGYALPRLLRNRSALSAAMIVGLIHMIWHLPLYGVEYDSANVLPWGITVFCFSIVTAWIWLKTGSILMSMMMHASNNTIAVVWRMFEGGDQLQLWWLWCLLWVVFAATIVALKGPELGRSSRQQTEA